MLPGSGCSSPSPAVQGPAGPCRCLSVLFLHCNRELMVVPASSTCYKDCVRYVGSTQYTLAVSLITNSLLAFARCKYHAQYGLWATDQRNRRRRAFSPLGSWDPVCIGILGRRRPSPTSGLPSAYGFPPPTTCPYSNML